MALQHDSERRHRLVRAILELLADSAPTEDGRPGRPISLVTAEEDATAYIIALVDLLVAMGVVEFEPESMTVQVVSAQAGYFLRLLLEHSKLDSPLVADWHHEGCSPQADHPFARGVDLLAALDHRRRAIDPDATPLRVNRAATGLIVRRDDTGQRHYLLAWDAPARAWQLIGGRYEAHDGNLRNTMLRELVEELECIPLSEPKDVTLSEFGPPIVTERVSPTYGLLTRTVFQVYIVHFLVLPTLPRYGVRWISEVELMEGITNDHQPIAVGPFRSLFEQLDTSDILETIQKW